MRRLFASASELADIARAEGPHVIRHLAGAITIAIATACASAPAHATGFLVAIEDVPLMQGLTEQPEPVIFESENGRVVRTSAEGQVGATRIGAFYAASLPQLGWKPTDIAGTYERENETLRIAICEPANNQPVTVSFELIVKLASSRLAD